MEARFIQNQGRPISRSEIEDGCSNGDGGSWLRVRYHVERGGSEQSTAVTSDATFQWKFLAFVFSNLFLIIDPAGDQSRQPGRRCVQEVFSLSKIWLGDTHESSYKHRSRMSYCQHSHDPIPTPYSRGVSTRLRNVILAQRNFSTH